MHLYFVKSFCYNWPSYVLIGTQLYWVNFQFEMRGASFTFFLLKSMALQLKMYITPRKLKKMGCKYLISNFNHYMDRAIGYLIRSSVTSLFTVGYNIILNIHQQLHNKAKIKRKNGASRTNLSLDFGFWIEYSNLLGDLNYHWVTT